MSKMQLPYDIEVEKAVLGVSFLNEDGLDIMCSELKSDDFYDPINRLLYETIKKMASDNVSVSYATVNTALKDDKTYIGCKRVSPDGTTIVGGLQYITHLNSAFPSIADVDDYIRIIKDCAIRRFAVKMCKSMYYDLQSNNDSGETIVSRYATKLSETVTIPDKQPWTLKTLDSWEHWMLYKDDLAKYPHWAFTEVDQQLGPLLGYELVVIGAVTGIGKTMFSLQDACYKAEHGIPTAFYSAEMNTESMGRRVFRIDHKRKMNDLGEESRDMIYDCMSKWHNLPLEIVSETRYDAITSSIRRLHRQGRCRVAYVDFLQYLTIPGEKNENEETKLARMVLGYATLAKELEIDIVLVSQFNREAGKTGYPTKKDLRGSGKIEICADRIILLYYPIATKSKFEGEIYAVTEKNRDGITGARVSLEWNIAEGLFYDRPSIRTAQQELFGS